MDASINLELLARDALKELRQEFIAKFGREPTDDDPVFFDPDGIEPKPLSEEKLTQMAVAEMKRAGIRPDLIYCFEKTGLILTTETYRTADRRKRRAWDAAMRDYHSGRTGGNR